MFVDDVLVYRGVLKRAPEAAQGQAVLFTNQLTGPSSARGTGSPQRDVEVSLFIDEGRWSSRVRISGRGRR